MEPNPPTNEPVDVMGFIKGLEEFPVSKLKQTNAGMQEKDPFVGLPYDNAKEVYCEGMNALVCSRFKSFDDAINALKLVYRRSFIGSSVTNKEKTRKKITCMCTNVNRKSESSSSAATSSEQSVITPSNTKTKRSKTHRPKGSRKSRAKSTQEKKVRQEMS